MKASQRTAAGAAALVAAGLLSVASASASATSVCSPQAKADRITSAQQLKAGIAAAAAHEKQGSTASLSKIPLGGYPPPGSN